MTSTIFPKLYVRQIWTVFDEQVSLVLEVRSIWPKGVKPKQQTISRCFDSSAYPDMTSFRLAVETYVAMMNRHGYNIYATLNPLKEGLSQNHSASDTDVICRRRLLVDIDRDHGKEHPATDEEVEAAGLLAERIRDYLTELGWPQPIRVMSGNGHHLVYRLNDLPNSQETTKAVRDLLHNLKRKFSGEGLSVDTSVSNASRVTKLPGTLARRGTEVQNRPYRVARIYE